MTKLDCVEFAPGRRFIGRLPHGRDLLTSIKEFCTNASIQTASFSFAGQVSAFTIGTYDQEQHVYITYAQEAPLEIVSGSGNVSLMDGDLQIHAHAVLADKQGKTIGGRLFSDTILFAGEIEIQELTGKPAERAYDPDTGLSLWKTR